MTSGFHIQASEHTHGNNMLKLSNSKDKTIGNLQKNFTSSMNTQNYILPIAKEIQITQVERGGIPYQTKIYSAILSQKRERREKCQVNNDVKVFKASGENYIIGVMFT